LLQRDLQSLGGYSLADQECNRIFDPLTRLDGSRPGGRLWARNGRRGVIDLWVGAQSYEKMSSHAVDGSASLGNRLSLNENFSAQVSKSLSKLLR
jgi:hypothetical protein